jgi:hypothetical protein
VAGFSDDELLVPRFPIGQHRGDLVAIVDTGGNMQGGVLNERDYFGDDPWLIQSVIPLAAASSGLAFAANGGGDPMVSVYSTDRALVTKVGYKVIDDSGTHDVPSSRTLRGDMSMDQMRKLPGEDAAHGARFLATLTGLADSAVVLVFRRFDTIRGVDMAAPAVAATIRWCGGGWRLSNATPIPGMIAGTGHQGEILVLSYGDANHDRYRLHRLSPQYSGDVRCDAVSE